jgi:hypothetical protein
MPIEVENKREKPPVRLWSMESMREGREGAVRWIELTLIPLCQDPDGSDWKRIIKKGDFRRIRDKRDKLLELNKR